MSRLTRQTGSFHVSEWLDLMMEEVERKQQELDEAIAETERREESGKASGNRDDAESGNTDDDSADDHQAA